MRTPELTDSLTRALDSRSANLFVAMPGRVEKYANGKADVKPLIKHVDRDPDGERQASDIPVIPGVPVVWPGEFLLAVGDSVLLVFCDRDIGLWFASNGTVTDPNDEETHGLQGAVCIPGMTTIAARTLMVTDFVALAGKVTAELEALKDAISGATIVANDGGASFKSTLLTALAAWPGPVAASKAKVQ